MKQKCDLGNSVTASELQISNLCFKNMPLPFTCSLQKSEGSAEKKSSPSHFGEPPGSLSFHFSGLFHPKRPQLITKAKIIFITLCSEGGGPLQLQDTPCLIFKRNLSKFCSIKQVAKLIETEKPFHHCLNHSFLSFFYFQLHT